MQRKIIVSLYVLCVLLVIVMLAIGITSFFTTFVFYTWVAALALLLTNALAGNYPVFHKIKLSAISILATLFACEFVLWFFIRPNDCLSYQERLGKYTYHSNTLMQKFRFMNRYIAGTWQWFAVNDPNTERFVGEPNHQYSHRYNSAGFRDTDVPVAKNPRDIRIMALGDSFTEGVGTPADSTWPYLLNQQLQTDSVYRVMNCGAGGSDPFFEYMLLKCRLLKYQPDVVLVCFNQSDIYDVIERGGFERFLPDSTIRLKDSPAWEYLYGASMITRLVAHRILHYNWLLRKEAEFKRMEQDAVAQLKTCADSFYTLAQQQHFKLVIIVHPLLSNFKEGDYKLLPLANQLKPDSTLLVINLMDGFKKQMEMEHLTPEQLYWPIDMHNNSTGYRLWSKALYADLKAFIPLTTP